ncbi:MAG TPA: N-acetylmuramoyl-L-alanine amidase [Chloroflexota bacterium]|nr:N-acetylmuramoyl-L-alanine amidase [Chloroflexota bacterium]
MTPRTAEHDPRATRAGRAGAGIALVVLLAMVPIVVACVVPRVAPTPEAPQHQESAGALDWPDDGRTPVASDDARTPIAFDGTGDFPSFPLPDGEPAPLGPALFRSGFSNPLPPSPVWDPPGQKRVGIQAGHWKTSDVPYELRNLSPGTSAGGWQEWEVNLLIANKVKEILEDAGVAVDLLPSTVPIRYRAHAFVAIHADGDANGSYAGYKIARSGFSSIPDADDVFVDTLYREYATTTGLPRDSDAHISRRMIYYYAFNTRRYQHAIDLGTPAAIIETGYLTNAGDRALLTNRPELPAEGIANGILRYLELEIGAMPDPSG